MDCTAARARAARLAIAAFTLGAAWDPPRRAWHVPFAAAVLCIPFYVASVRIERWVAARRWPGDDASRWSARANRLTYGVIAGGLLVLTGFLAVR